MTSATTHYAFLAIRILLTCAFAAAGIAKLMGVPMMVATFDLVGAGQWFRIVTGLIEVGAAILLWVPGMQAIAAALLVCTMIGAIIAHLTVLPSPVIPAVILGILAAATVWANRAQLASR